MTIVVWQCQQRKKYLPDVGQGKSSLQDWLKVLGPKQPPWLKHLRVWRQGFINVLHTKIGNNRCKV